MASVTSFRHVSYPVRLHAGDNALDRLGEEADRTRARRAFVVCGQSVAHRTNLLERVKYGLGERFAGVFDGAQAGSPLPSVELGVGLAREAEADLIVAVGGGSAVVTARAIIILLAEGGTAHQHATRYPPGQRPISPRLMQPKIPNIVVATTPTTATNRAGTAVIDPETQHRLELFDPKTRPSAIFWDTEALLTAPTSLCLSAASSMFSGVVGNFQSARLNPLAEADLVQALGFLRRDMLLVQADGDGSGQARLELCAASFLSNRASDSGAGGGSLSVVSALAHSLDTRYPDCDHGAAYSIATAPGMRFNREHNLAGQARLADYMQLRQPGMDDRQAAKAAADTVARTYRELAMPERLRDVGIPEGGIPQLAQDAMTDFGLHRNVRPVEDTADLVELLGQIW